MTLVQLVDRRATETVVFPRYRVEDAMVDFQAASDEASALITIAARQIGDAEHPAIRTLASADTLVRYIGLEAWDLAGDLGICPDNEDDPGHGRAA